MSPTPSHTAIDMGEGDAGFILGNGAVGVLLIHGLTGTPID